MKKPLSIILLSALMVALTATGCSNPVGDFIQPSGSVDASSAEPTVQPTDTPVTASTQDRQYTAMELADMSLDEIKALMGGEYTSEHVQLSNAFSSDGTSYVFNYAVLPGFAFETYENDYRGISIMDGAKLDDRISSDMTNHERLSGLVLLYRKRIHPQQQRKRRQSFGQCAEKRQSGVAKHRAPPRTACDAYGSTRNGTGIRTDPSPGGIRIFILFGLMVTHR